uniref:Uncharacterized protein n=1 Tax=Trichuris muris TaxID=70415 RepID=A0A5S6R0C4_TRIMR
MYGEYPFEDPDNFMRQYGPLCGDEDPDMCVARLLGNYNLKPGGLPIRSLLDAPLQRPEAALKTRKYNYPPKRATRSSYHIRFGRK